MSADLRSAVIDIGMFLNLGRKPANSTERPNRDVVQVGRDAIAGALKGRGSRAYTDLPLLRQRNVGGAKMSWTATGDIRACEASATRKKTLPAHYAHGRMP